jgi:hypothetical protein
LKKERVIRLLLLGLLALSAVAHAEQKEDISPVYVDSVTNLEFPSKLNPLEYVRVVEYENKDLGYCVLYSSNRDYAQICVYDRGNKTLSTGIHNPEFKDEFRAAVENTLIVTNTAPYHDGRIIAESTPSIGSDEKVAEGEMKIFTSTLTGPENILINNTHLVLMSCGLGKFIKLNYTGKDLTPSEFGERTKQVVEAFVRFNGSTTKAFLIDRKNESDAQPAEDSLPISGGVGRKDLKGESK